MKIALSFFLMIVLFALTGCRKERVENEGEACSIKLSGIHFTRSLNHAAESSVLKNGTIIIRSDAKKDFFNDPDGKQSTGSAPILLAEVDNTKPFTLTAKVTPEFNTTYDAGALYVFSSAMLWQKFAFERDERGRTRIVSVRTIETSDDNNHDVVTEESVYLKISSDTNTVGFYYSTDNQTWNLARLYKNSYPTKVWLGVSSQSPTGDGNMSAFEDCILTDKAISDFRLGI
jgi:uncharacterized protein